MIQKFVDLYMASKDALRAKMAAEHPQSYDHLVSLLVSSLHIEGRYDNPDPKRIHTIDDGDYQGTRLFIIACEGYQPSTYWTIKVDYGSCSGCDTFQRIQEESGYGNTPATASQIDQYMTLMLHMVQSMQEI